MSISYEPQAAASVPMSEEERNTLLVAWQKAKTKLDSAKESEMELRKKIVSDSGLFDPDKESGTQSVELGNGWKIKAVKKLNYNVANKEGEAFTMLTRLAAISEISAYKAKKLFRFDANLSLTAYRDLDETELAMVSEIVTTKPASPSLELVAPKSKK